MVPINMKKYMKSTLTGVIVYLLTLVVYFGIFVNEPNEFILILLVGPFFWIPLLAYPGIILLTIIFVLNKRNYYISTSFISSSIIVFGLGLILIDENLKNHQGQKHLHCFLVAAVSCFIGFMYAKWRTPNKRV